jgi:hypothetical protein
VRELAMRAVDRTPLLDQIEDRLLLPAKDPMHRVTDRPAILERARLLKLPAPAVHAHVLDLEHPARTRVRPPGRNGAVDEAHQLELGLRAHARRDRAEKPERCPPRCKVSSTANSFNASESRSFSTSAASSSARSGEGIRPSLDAANAASAASFASCRIRITVLTSTPHFRAASACVNCWEATSRNTSHFSSGDSCLRLRGLPFSIITSSWFGTRTASQDWREKQGQLYPEFDSLISSRCAIFRCLQAVHLTT